MNIENQTSCTSDSLTSCFTSLDAKEKLSALKRLSKGKKIVIGCTAEAPKTLEQKYDAISQCINCCTEHDLKILELELRKERISLECYSQFGNILPLFLSCITIFSTLFGSLIAATKTDIFTSDFSFRIVYFLLIIALACIFAIVYFSYHNISGQRKLQTITYLQAIITKQSNFTPASDDLTL